MFVSRILVANNLVFCEVTFANGQRSWQVLPWAQAQQYGALGLRQWLAAQSWQPEVPLPDWMAQLVGVTLS